MQVEEQGAIPDAIETGGVDPGLIQAGAGEDEVVGDVEVAGGSGVFVGARDGQHVVPGRDYDGVLPGEGVRLLDRGAQGAGPDRGGADPISGQDVDLIGGAVDVEGPRVRE